MKQVGNRLRTHLQRFEELAKEVHFTKTCESARFMRRVSVRLHYKTIHDLNDGLEGRTGACREYTKPRDDPGSEIKAWIGGHTEIGPVLQVPKILFRLETGSGMTFLPCSSSDSQWLVFISRFQCKNSHDILL